MLEIERHKNKVTCWQAAVDCAPFWPQMLTCSNHNTSLSSCFDTAWATTNPGGWGWVQLFTLCLCSRNYSEEMNEFGRCDAAAITRRLHTSNSPISDGFIKEKATQWFCNTVWEENSINIKLCATSLSTLLTWVVSSPRTCVPCPP